MSWDSIVGQARVKHILRSTLQRSRLPHAYLFSGDRGVGTDAAAIELAKIVNCERRKGEACDVCQSCRAVHDGRHPNIQLVISLPAGKGEKSGDDPFAKLSEDDLAAVRAEVQRKFANPYVTISIPRATSIKINSIRKLRLESSRSLFGKGKRVFLIFDADLLTDEAGNALLKALEEPHDDTMLILTTAHPAKILPTILSRCQHVQFDPVESALIADELRRREKLSAEEAALIAGFSGGSYGKAVELNGPELKGRRNDAIAFLRTALYKRPSELLGEIERLQSAYDRSGLAEMFMILEGWFRDAQMVQNGTNGMESGMDRETIDKFVAHHPTVHYDRLFASLSRAVSLLEKNVYIQLILITLVLELRTHILPSQGRRGGIPSVLRYS